MKRKKPNLNLYVVMYSYTDSFATTTGKVEISAKSRKDAERIFYKLNRKYVIGIGEDKNPIFNPRGGYVCEAVLTYNEWKKEGSPTSL